MKINIDTKFDIFDEVRYKKLDVFTILDGKEPKEEIKQSQIVAIDVQVGKFDQPYIYYLMDNEDRICGDFILETL